VYDGLTAMCNCVNSSKNESRYKFYCAIPIRLKTVMADHFTSGHLWCIHQPPSLTCSDAAYQRGFRVFVTNPQWICGFLHDILCVLNT